MPKITELPTATTVTPDDYVLIVNAPGDAQPTTQHARISDILSLATTILAGANYQGTWAASATYLSAAVVSYNGSVFISLQNANTNQTPPTTGATAWWQTLVAQGPPGPQGPTGGSGTLGAPGLPSTWDASNWVTGNTYAKGTAVHHANGNSYVSVVSAATTDPSVTSGPGGSWRLISERGVQGVKPFTSPVVWSNPTVYTAGSLTTPASAVFQTASSYVCIVSHTSGPTFATDLSAGRWQLIAAPGGINAVTAIAPITVNNAVANTPAIGASTNVANGLTQLNASANIFNSQRPRNVVRFSHATQNPNVTGTIGGTAGDTAGGTAAPWTNGTAGATFVGNPNFASKVRMARVIVPGDPTSVGAMAYTRRVELEATLNLAFNGGNVGANFCWVVEGTGVRLSPTVLAAGFVTDGYSSVFQTTVTCRTHTTPAPAANTEAYVLYCWIENGGGMIYNANVGGHGQYDCVTAIPYASIG